MSETRLIELSYYDPGREIRLKAYADTIVTNHDAGASVITAIRFGGGPEMVRAMSDAIYGGAAIEARRNGKLVILQSFAKGYRRQLTHDGVYSVATLMANDDARTADDPEDAGKKKKSRKEEPEPEEPDALAEDGQTPPQPRRCYIFCPAGDTDLLFEELDRKTAAPLIPDFRDYVLTSLMDRGELRKLDVFSLKEPMDAWVLDLKPDDANVVEILEQGLKTGAITSPGAAPGQPDGFAAVETVTGYLNAFGVTVADRIRDQFDPLFDPAKEPLSDEVLEINRHIQAKAGYPLYDAQLAVAEATKRQLQRRGVALIRAECGSGKTKMGAAALGALYGMWAAQHKGGRQKSFGLVMCPSHMTRKWVREIGETLPNTRGCVVRSISDLDRLYAAYETGEQSVYAVFSKERARDGYLRTPAVRWSRRKKGFLCPDCGKPVQMEISEDGVRYAIVSPPNVRGSEDILPKEEKALEIVRTKIAAGERVMIYTSWTRTDSQQKLLKLLREEGFRTEVLTPKIPPEKREAWVEKQVRAGVQVLITNPRCVETGLDLNAFTTLIFYSMGYNLFTLRQASRRSWRINQTAPRVEVYLLYYADTMQAKAMKLMASKLAVAGIIEGAFSDEGLAAMSDVKDLTSQMAKELAQGIKDNVEDIAAAFKKMAVVNPDRNRKQEVVIESTGRVLEEEPPEAVKQPALTVRETGAVQRRNLCEGLLERTMEEQKKRRPKVTELENQLSLFGPAA